MAICCNLRTTPPHNLSRYKRFRVNKQIDLLWLWKTHMTEASCNGLFFSLIIEQHFIILRKHALFRHKRNNRRQPPWTGNEIDVSDFWGEKPLCTMLETLKKNLSCSEALTSRRTSFRIWSRRVSTSKFSTWKPMGLIYNLLTRDQRTEVKAPTGKLPPWSSCVLSFWHAVLDIKKGKKQKTKSHLISTLSIHLSDNGH